MNRTQTFEPKVFAAGETLIWTKEFNAYSPADGWTLTYYFRGPTKFDAAAVSDPDNAARFKVTIPAATTKDCLAGQYFWQAWISSAGGEKHVLHEGRIICKVGLSSQDGFDGRSNAEQIVEAIDAIAKGKATKDQQEYQIGDRHLRQIPIPELLALRDRYARIVARERLAQKVAQGGDLIGNINVRF